MSQAVTPRERRSWQGPVVAGVWRPQERRSWQGPVVAGVWQPRECRSMAGASCRRLVAPSGLSQYGKSQLSQTGDDCPLSQHKSVWQYGGQQNIVDQARREACDDMAGGVSPHTNEGTEEICESDSLGFSSLKQ